MNINLTVNVCEFEGKLWLILRKTLMDYFLATMNSSNSKASRDLFFWLPCMLILMPESFALMFWEWDWKD